MDRVIYIKAYFCAIGKEVVTKVLTGEVEKGMFGGKKEVKKKIKKWKQTGWSKTEIDGKRLSSDLGKSIKELNENGYFVKTITPIISGAYNFNSEGIKSSKRLLSETEAVKGGASYGYGYSYTDSLIIVANKSA